MHINRYRNYDFVQRLVLDLVRRIWRRSWVLVSQCHSGSRLLLWPMRFENESATTEAAIFRIDVTRLDWLGATCIHVYRRVFCSLPHLSRLQRVAT